MCISFPPSPSQWHQAYQLVDESEWAVVRGEAVGVADGMKQARQGAHKRRERL